MISKKNEWTPTAQKNYNSSAPRPQQQRREPEVVRNTAYPQNTQTVSAPTPPTSPLATAQARRTTSANNFGARQDQLRKLTVGRDIALNGEIETCDHLVVEGNVKATIKGGKILEIADCGSFSGVVDIEQADIAGRFDGHLVVRGKLIVRATAIVTGTIQYAALQVDTGAVINGELGAMMAAVQTPRPQITETHETQQTSTQNIQDDQTRLFSFTAINDEPGFLKASA